MSDRSRAEREAIAARAAAIVEEVRRVPETARTLVEATDWDGVAALETRLSGLRDELVQLLPEVAPQAGTLFAGVEPVLAAARRLHAIWNGTRDRVAQGRSLPAGAEHDAEHARLAGEIREGLAEYVELAGSLGIEGPAIVEAMRRLDEAAPGGSGKPPH